MFVTALFSLPLPTALPQLRGAPPASPLRPGPGGYRGPAVCLECVSHLSAFSHSNRCKKLLLSHSTDDKIKAQSC